MGASDQGDGSAGGLRERYRVIARATGFTNSDAFIQALRLA